MQKLTVILIFTLVVLLLWLLYDRFRLIESNQRIMSYWVADYAYVQSVEGLKTALASGRSCYFAPGTHLVLNEPIEIPKNVNLFGGQFSASNDFPTGRAMPGIRR